MRIEPAKRRSSKVQLAAMRRQWPDFVGRRLNDGTLIWHGSLRPKAQAYRIGILWHPTMPLPYVIVSDPPLQPRPGMAFAEIPHLIYDADEPKQSGLCLFDPAGREWSPADLIADTTVWWAAEWLTYYELWHMTGKWLAPSVGYESVAQMMSAEVEAAMAVLDDVH
ncbi:hypothetical protein [Shumkonia mesophila]|uniref:hypothetical protein n=1 Tax=Shumkonia mesophila TaxID=2838854 RepID=UPI00293454E5|nr:hypothetical protein [Shumkonia mesophila]